MSEPSRILVVIALAGQVALATPAAAQMEPDIARAAFEAADADGDGVIDEAELSSDAASAFSGLDRNGDSFLEADEFEPSVDGAGLREIDASGDGRLTFDEVMAHKLDQMSRADQNGDGVISLDEALEYNKAS